MEEGGSREEGGEGREAERRKMQQDVTYLQSLALNLQLRQWRWLRRKRWHLLTSSPWSLGGRLRRRAAFFSSFSSSSQLLARSASRFSSPLTIIPPLPSVRPTLAPPHLLTPPPTPFSQAYLLFFHPQLLKLRVAAVVALPTSLRSKRQHRNKLSRASLRKSHYILMCEQTVGKLLFLLSCKMEKGFAVRPAKMKKKHTEVKWMVTAASNW